MGWRRESERVMDGRDHILLARFDETVSGTIIGGRAMACRLYYEGRPQGPRMFVDSDAEARNAGENALAEIKAECGEAFRMIYPRDDAWECRIYD